MSLPRKEFVGVESNLLSRLADNIFSPDFSTGNVIYDSLLPKRSRREFISWTLGPLRFIFVHNIKSNPVLHGLHEFSFSLNPETRLLMTLLPGHSCTEDSLWHPLFTGGFSHQGTVLHTEQYNCGLLIFCTDNLLDLGELFVPWFLSHKPWAPWRICKRHIYVFC